MVERPQDRRGNGPAASIRTVAIVSKLYPPFVGGVEAHAASLAERLAAREPGIRVVVITGQEGRARGRREHRNGVEVWRAGTVARVARTPLAPRLGRLLREAAADVYHFHVPYPWGEAAALAARLRAPCVVTYHHDVVRQRVLGRLYRPVLDTFLRRASRIIAWSPQLVTHSQVLARHARRCVVIPGGIDCARFARTARSTRAAAALRARLAPGGPVILFVGRLVYYKGLKVLLRAFQSVPGTLVIVGDGPLRAELERLAESLGVRERVRFRGAVADGELPLYYQAADVLVLPSTDRTEAFGLVQLEAHASGVPTVSTDLPTGVPYVNAHGTTGLVVPPGQTAPLSDALRLLIGDEGLRVGMGEAARRRALEHFDIDGCAERVMDVYREAVQGAARAGGR